VWVRNVDYDGSEIGRALPSLLLKVTPLTIFLHQTLEETPVLESFLAGMTVANETAALILTPSDL
jgi:hypothetical protein